MNTMNEINSLLKTDQPKWFENMSRNIVIMALTIGVTLGGAMLANKYDPALKDLASAVFAITASILMLVVFPILGTLSQRYETRVRNQTLGQLRTLDRNTLVQMSSSPEVTEYHQCMAIEVLNERYPGWSFQLQTVNATR